MSAPNPSAPNPSAPNPSAPPPGVPAHLLDSLTSDPLSWSASPGLVSVSQLSPSGLDLLFRTSSSMRSVVRDGGGGDDRLKRRVLATVFFEASTRTACSFQAAVLRLGGSYQHVDCSASGGASSSKKGESLEDTVRCLERYADVVVLRHPERGSAGRCLAGATRTLINAGDGAGEHPTQALLDLYTVCDELGVRVGGGDDRTRPSDGPPRGGRLVVVMLGDLRHGRTVHSLAELLARSGLDEDVELRYVSPDGLGMPEYVTERVEGAAAARARGAGAGAGGAVRQGTYGSLVDALDGADVLYVTRVQRERFDSREEYERVKGSYVVDADLLSSAPPAMIVMHPLPRVDEISTDVDADPRAAYFRQTENGMYVRMALLALLLGRP